MLLQSLASIRSQLNIQLEDSRLELINGVMGCGCKIHHYMFAEL